MNYVSLCIFDEAESKSYDDNFVPVKIWQGLSVRSCDVGVSLTGQNGFSRGAGSLTLVDSVFQETSHAILIAPLDLAVRDTAGG